MSVRNVKNVAISTFINITVTSHSSRYGGKMKVFSKNVSNTGHSKFKAGHIYKIIFNTDSNEDLLEDYVICSDEGKLIDLTRGYTLATIDLNEDIFTLNINFIEDVTRQALLKIENKCQVFGPDYENEFINEFIEESNNETQN